MPKNVADEDLKMWTGPGYEKYQQICQKKNILKIQDKAWMNFKEYGNIGIYWAFGSGKSLFGHRLIGSL